MSTQLRELLSEAAQSEVRPDLAERAISGARTRRRQRLVVGSSVLAAAAVVLGVVVGSGDLRTDAEPRPTDVASLPAQLPAADGLPPLVDGTMDAASAAYVVNGEVVVIDAATGDGAVVDFESMPLNFLGPMTGVTDGSPLALSPDGQYLAIVPGRPRSEDGSKPLLLVDVRSGVISPQARLTLGSGGAARPQMAWSPDGESFACICNSTGAGSTLLVADVTLTGDDGQLSGLSGISLTPLQISWGTDGLAADFAVADIEPAWRLVPLGDQSTPNPEKWPPVESVSMLYPGVLDEFGLNALAMGHSDLGGFLARIRDGSLWVEWSSGERTIVGNLGARPTLGALGESYYVVFTDWKGEPLNSEVTRVDLEGETILTMLPPGATTISFASGLVD